MPCRNLVRLYIHLTFTSSVGPSIIIWNELGQAPPLQQWRCLNINSHGPSISSLKWHQVSPNLWSSRNPRSWFLTPRLCFIMVCESTGVVRHGVWVTPFLYLRPTMSLMPALSPMPILIYPPESVVSTPTELVNGGPRLGNDTTVHLSLSLKQITSWTMKRAWIYCIAHDT